MEMSVGSTENQLVEVFKAVDDCVHSESRLATSTDSKTKKAQTFAFVGLIADE